MGNSKKPKSTSKPPGSRTATGGGKGTRAGETKPKAGTGGLVKPRSVADEPPQEHL